MSKATKLKEAIKTGLAFALVFGIAMQLGWMNPYWAGWAVAVIALPTAGESIRKGISHGRDDPRVPRRPGHPCPGAAGTLALHVAYLRLGVHHHLPDGEPAEGFLPVGDGMLRLPHHPPVRFGFLGEHVRKRRVSYRRNGNGGRGLYPDLRFSVAADQPGGDQEVECGTGSNSE